MSVKTPYPPVDTLPGYQPGMVVSLEVQELMSMGNSVLYAPPDDPRALAMPAKCADHPGGVEGWLEEVYKKRDAYRRTMRLYGLEFDDDDDDPAPNDTGMEVEDVPREPSREQLGKQIDKALAYQGHCPTCGGEPVLIFKERAYCIQAERVHHSQREKHGWDVHDVSPSQRRSIEQSMASWRRDPSVRFAHPTRNKSIQSPIARAPEPVDLDALMASREADLDSNPIDIDALPPAQLHTEAEPEFYDHLDTEVAEELRAEPEPQPQRERPPYFRGFKVCFRGVPHAEHRWDTLEAPDQDGVRWPAEYRCPGVESHSMEEEVADPYAMPRAAIRTARVTIEPPKELGTTNPDAGTCDECNVFCEDLAEHFRDAVHSPDLDVPELETDVPKTRTDYIDRLINLIDDGLQAEVVRRTQRRLAARAMHTHN